MAVKGLIPAFISLGNIKAGGKGKMITSSKGNEFRPPEKWDHFKITTNEKTSDGDFVIDTDLMRKIGNESGLQEIPCRVLYNDTDLIFPTRYASYLSGRLICSGDGENAESMGKIITCPCDRLKPGYAGSDKCKINGILSVIIDDSEIFGGCHIFRTTSINTCKSILGSIQAIKAVTGGIIANIPLSLCMQPKNTVTPQGQKVIIYVVSLIYKGSMESLQQKALSMLKSQQEYYNNMKMIENNAPKLFQSDIDIDIVEEFYPDAIPQIEAPKIEKDEKITQNKTQEKQPFGGKKAEIVKLYNEVLIEDLNSWKNFFNENNIEVPEKLILDICKSKDFENHETWISELKKIGIEDPEFLQKIQYEIAIHTGRNRWNDSLKAHGVHKASELNEINVDSFIRLITDVPF